MSVDYTKIFEACATKTDASGPLPLAKALHRAYSQGVVDSARMRTWKKIGVTVLWTCALGLAVLVVGIGSEVARSNPPLAQPTSAWNSRAIEASPVGVRVQEIDSTHSAVVFLYDLNNTTDSDYRLAKGPSIVIMSRLKAGGTLSGDEQISLDSAAFVPARNRTRIVLELNHAFNWPGQKSVYAERMFDQLVMNDVAGVTGFVLFDQANRYEIDFPAAWPENHTPSSTP